MPEFCTCGAQLPPDARFCHRCGKPQFEEEQPAAVPESVHEPLVEPPPPPLALTFHNPVAVRVGFTMASFAALLSSLPILKFGLLIWLFFAGLLSVYFYHRRTGQPLTVRSGARMGWITGVMSFVIITVLFTVSMIMIATSSGGLAATYREQFRGMPMDQNMEAAMQIFQSPGGVLMVVLFSLCLLFFMTTLLCTAGGVVGAKISGKD
jgi:hypothetical protein